MAIQMNTEGETPERWASESAWRALICRCPFSISLITDWDPIS